MNLSTHRRREFLLDTRWAIEEQALATITELYQRATSGDKETTALITRALAAARDTAPAADAPAYNVADGVAVIEFSGVVTKRPTCMGSFFGGDAVTQALIDALAKADGDPTVSSKLLVIDSPGGTVAGTAAAAEAVYRSNMKKPVVAYAEDQAASAAYWIASQAGRFLANSTAQVGSIGVFAVIPDVSRAYENAGVRMNLVKAGEMKGTGVRGMPVTDAQLADVQREIDAIYEEFISAVARGRKLSPNAARQLADGRVHTGRTAQGLGLVDGVQELSDVLAEMRAKATAQLVLFPTTSRAAVPLETTPRVEALVAPDAPKEDTMDETTTTAAAPAATAPAPVVAPDQVASAAATAVGIDRLVEAEVQKRLEAAAREKAIKASLDTHATKYLPAHREYAERLAKADLEAFEKVMGAARDVQPSGKPVYQPAKSDGAAASTTGTGQGKSAIVQMAEDHMQRTGEKSFEAAVLAVTTRAA
jgi:signal peptide peptidase SppA